MASENGILIYERDSGKYKNLHGKVESHCIRFSENQCGENYSIFDIEQLENVLNFSTLRFKRHLSVGGYFDAGLNLTLPAQEISRQAQVNNSSLSIVSKMLAATKIRPVE